MNIKIFINLRHIVIIKLCAFLFFSNLFSQERDGNINIYDFQYDSISGIPIVFDETGESTYYLNEKSPNIFVDRELGSLMLDGSISIPLGSYYLPKMLNKSLDADSMKHISQIFYRKGDYDFSDLGIGIQIESIDSTKFTYRGLKRSQPQLYQNGEDQLQNHIFSIERNIRSTSIQVATLYHYEDFTLPLNFENASRKVESFHGGLNFTTNWRKLVLKGLNAYQFTYVNQASSKVSYLSLWNFISGRYKILEKYSFLIDYEHKKHFIEKEEDLFNTPYQIVDVKLEYSGNSIVAGFGGAVFESSLIPIVDLLLKKNNYYISFIRKFDVNLIKNQNSQTDALELIDNSFVIGYDGLKYKTTIELFNVDYKNESTAGLRFYSDIKLKWLNIEQKIGFFDLSTNAINQPLDYYSMTSLLFSPDIWFWEDSRYQPFVGAQSIYIKHSGDLGLDPTYPPVFRAISFPPYASNLLNLEIGLLVNQFKLSYKWINFSFSDNNIVKNSFNETFSPVFPIRHFEVIWQFWN